MRAFRGCEMDDPLDFWANVKKYQEALTAFQEKRRLDTIVMGLLKMVQQGSFTVNRDLMYNLEWPSTLPDPEVQACVEFMEAVNTEKWDKKRIHRICILRDMLYTLSVSRNPFRRAKMKTLVRLVMTGHSISVLPEGKLDFVKTFPITKSFKRERVIAWLDKNGYEPNAMSKQSFPWLEDINWNLVSEGR